MTNTITITALRAALTAALTKKQPQTLFENLETNPETFEQTGVAVVKTPLENGTHFWYCESFSLSTTGEIKTSLDFFGCIFGVENDELEKIEVIDAETGETGGHTHPKNFDLPAAAYAVDYSALLNNSVIDVNAKIADLKNSLINAWSDYLYRHDAYVSDVVSNAADSMIDIYYSDLLKWFSEARDSDEYMTEAVNAGMVSTENYSFFSHIQTAQYLYYQNELNDELADALRLYAYQILLDNEVEKITPLQYQEIEDLEFDEYEKFQDLENDLHMIVGW